MQLCHAMYMDMKLSERLVVMVSPEQKRLIHELADSTDMSVGEWVRHMLLPEQENPDLQQRIDELEQRVSRLEKLLHGESNHE